MQQKCRLETGEEREKEREEKKEHKKTIKGVKSRCLNSVLLMFCCAINPLTGNAWLHFSSSCLNGEFYSAI